MQMQNFVLIFMFSLTAPIVKNSQKRIEFALYF